MRAGMERAWVGAAALPAQGRAARLGGSRGPAPDHPQRTRGGEMSEQPQEETAAAEEAGEAAESEQETSAEETDTEA